MIDIYKSIDMVDFYKKIDIRFKKQKSFKK